MARQGSHNLIRQIALFVLLSALFTAIYTLSPLYRSTQNTYFLHGAAAAGVGLLADDWMSRSADPTPAFSAIVSCTLSSLHASVFFVIAALLFGAYAMAMLGLVRRVLVISDSTQMLLFVAAFLAMHAIVVRAASQKLLFGLDLPYLLHQGLATQWALSPKFAPSSFGVLFVPAVYFAIRDRWPLALVCTTTAATIHPTYILPAAILTLAFMIDSLQQRHGMQRALAIGVVAAVMILPIVAYVILTFQPAPEPVHEMARSLLADELIPHHTDPSTWNWLESAIQLAVLAGGLAAAWRTRLFWILASSVALALVLSLLVVVTGNEALALMFPWRISVALIPISTAIMIGCAVARIGPRMATLTPAGQRTIRAACCIAILSMACGGIAKMILERRSIASEVDRGVIDFAREHRNEGDLYLVPVPARADQPEVMRDFRLNAGVPIFVDMQTHPYRDDELIEWDRRVRLARLVYTGAGPRRDEAIRMIAAAYGITHIVWPVNDGPLPFAAEEVYRDEHYGVVRIEERESSR